MQNLIHITKYLIFMMINLYSASKQQGFCFSYHCDRKKKKNWPKQGKNKFEYKTCNNDLSKLKNVHKQALKKLRI